MILNKNSWSSLEKGEMKVLHQLDNNGFLIGENENLADYTKRLKEWEEAKKLYNKQVENTKKFSIQGQEFKLDNTIPNEVILEGGEISQKTYCFSIQDFASFFSKNVGVLSAAVTYFPTKKFFPFFILKNSLRKRKKFLIYDRNEIIAHEACHIARASMNSCKYEEFFAYYLSKSSLRKVLGSLFRTSTETFIFLIVLFLNLAGQFVGVFFARLSSFSMWTSVILLFIFCFLIARQLKLYFNFKKAVKKISLLSNHPAAILFRCSDKEIDKIIKTSSLNKKNLKKIIENPLRYNLIKTKFLT